jgi:peptidylprolyl isomerase
MRVNQDWRQWYGRWGWGILIAVILWLGQAGQAQATGLELALPLAYLPPGNAITDGRALLRNSLPIDNTEIRKLQASLEGLSEWLRSKRWGPISKDTRSGRKGPE